MALDEQIDIGLTEGQLAAVQTKLQPEVLTAAREFIEHEKRQTVPQALRDHWPAALWSVFLSMALVMEGFDLVILGSFYGQPAFLRKFGDPQPDGNYVINANWQTAVGNVGLVGTLIGLSITGYCQERFGSRPTYMTGMAAMIACIFLYVFATNIKMLCAAAIIFNIPMGMFQTLTTAYAAEICPLNLRGLLTSEVNLSWGIGLFLAAGVAKASLGIEGDLGWRLPFCLQWIWPLPLMLGAYFAPESPWWYVRKRRFDEAKASLIRVARTGYYDNKDLDAYMTYMQHTDELSRLESSRGSYRECFRGTNLRRTEIMFGIWIIQQWGGGAITSLAVQLFEDAGFSVAASFDLNLAINAMFIVGTIVSWILLPYCGRRALYLGALLAVAACLTVIGGLSTISNPSGKVLNAVGSIMVIINFLNNCSVGPICYTIAGEMPSSRVRVKTLAMGRGVYAICSAIIGQLNPRMVNPTAWNWGTKSAWFWLGTCLICTTWAYFRLPETGGFSFAELEVLFANKIDARKFRRVKVHDLESDHLVRGHGAPEDPDAKLQTVEQVEPSLDKGPVPESTKGQVSELV